MGFWINELTTGDATIDSQHKAICVFMDDLMQDAKTGNAEQRFPGALAFLRDHFTSHFAHEEALMKITRYPMIDEHMQEHLRFFDLFVLLKARIEKEGPDVVNVRILVESLATWLTDHVLGSDMIFADHVRTVRNGSTW